MPAQREMVVGRSKAACNFFSLIYLPLRFFQPKMLGTNRIRCLLKCLLIEMFMARAVADGR